MQIFAIIILLCLSAILSGMTIGMFSLGLGALERKIKLGDKQALKVYPLRKNGNLLLVTLLIANVAVNSTIAIILGDLVTGIIAGILATGLITLFGEALPQAVFARHALSFGSKMVWIVKFFIFILYPIAKPVALVLDKILGTETPLIMSKMEIAEMIKFHEDSPHSNIDEDEERIVLGALSYSEKVAYDIMTPKTVVYYLSEKSAINLKKINEIKQKGFSRIPVFSETTDNMIGILFTKDLIGLDLSEEKTAGELCRKDKFIYIEWNVHLDVLLNKMVKDKVHLSFVIDEFGTFNGIVTLEDIVEEILKLEIVDEADKITDMQKFAKEKVKSKLA